MKRTHWITLIVIAVASAILIGWDLIVVSNEVKGDTISALIWEGSQQLMAIPFAFGFMTGHLFWPSKLAFTRRLTPFQKYGTLGLGVLAFAVASLWLSAPPWLPLIIGFVFGHFFWANDGWEGE